jgi:hypothetical protein
MVDGLFRSTEFQTTVAPIVRLYSAYFLRNPGYPGFQFWLGKFRAGESLVAISEEFASSAEFVKRYGVLSNHDFVVQVYVNVLGRAGKQSGVDYWTAQLDSGALTRGGVMLSFSESAEYQKTADTRVFVFMMYAAMLRRAPSQTEFNNGVTYITNGNSRLDIINQILGSMEYAARFTP